MSITERSEILSRLYKLRADLGALYANCEQSRSMMVGVYVQAAQREINECLEQFQPDALPGAPIEFPGRKI
jgi:hypothetical protein